MLKNPLWLVRLKRDKQVVREYVVAPDAETAMATAKSEHDQYVVTRVERVNQIGNIACGGVLIAATKPSVPWCESCQSYHVRPETVEAWRALGCKEDRRDFAVKP